MDNLSVCDFENLLILKNQLITLPTERLVKVYDAISDYINFINSVIDLINEETPFLYLSDEFKRKIEDVIQVHRFDLYKETNDSINQIYDALNTIDDDFKIYYKHQEVAKANYLKFQEEIRKMKFYNREDFLFALSYDGVVMAGLKTNPLIIKEKKFFLASMNYLLEMAPKDFFDDTMIMNAEDKLKKFKDNSSILDINTRVNSNKILKKINNLN